MDKYIFSDLIMETSNVFSLKKEANDRKGAYSEEQLGDVTVCRINIKNDEHARAYNCKKGYHVTVYTPEILLMGEAEKQTLSKILAREIKAVVCATLNTRKIDGKRFLIAGIGNKRITPDAVGSMTVEKINVTRHVEKINPRDFARMRVASVCSVSCGVLGETGIEALEILRGVTQSCSPDCIIAIDALAAKDAGRLASTVQISDSGITPGAGIGNGQSVIDKSTLGVPVIAVGVPTVISAATVIAAAVKEMGSSVMNEKSERIIREKRNFFVTPKECDLICDAVSDVLARAIDRALGVI